MKTPTTLFCRHSVYKLTSVSFPYREQGQLHCLDSWPQIAVVSSGFFWTFFNFCLFHKCRRMAVIKKISGSSNFDLKDEWTSFPSRDLRQSCMLRPPTKNGSGTDRFLTDPCLSRLSQSAQTQHPSNTLSTVCLDSSTPSDCNDL